MDCVVAQVNHDAVKWNSSAESWIEDVVIACACIRGEQQAWHHLQLANTWRLREAAELRLSPQRASLLVERTWSELRASTRLDLDSPRMQEYHGGETVARWLVSLILSRIEEIPTGVPVNPPVGSTVDAILDTMPRLRTLACDPSSSGCVPQAT
ncbi:MAG: hypothetical protein EXS15_05895 [Phycisphaerales bacterium]|nr:hypothetical protein [Phycisphaerales bacterium]